MAITPTTAQVMVTEVRQRTHMETNQFVTDSEIIGLLNAGLCQLDMILISKFDDYKLTSVATTANAATGQIAVPADFLKFRGLDVQFSVGDPDGYARVRKYNFQHRNQKPYGFTGPVGYGPYAVTYRLQGNAVQIEPVGIAPQWPYRLWYTPDYVALVNPSDTLQSYMDTQSWYELGVTDACIKILAKQDLDPSTFLGQKAELVELITKLSAPNRDAGEPSAIVDTRGFPNGGGYGYDV